MTIYEKNSKAFAKTFPGWLEEVEQYSEKRDEELSIVTEDAYDGSKIFRINMEGRALYLNGKYEPQKAAEKWADGFSRISSASVFVFIGMGSGIYVKELLKKCKKKVTVIIYEPSVNIFLKALETTDFSYEIQNFKMIFLIEEYNSNLFEYTISQFMTYDRLSFFSFFVHPNYAELFPQSVLKCSKYANQLVESREVNKNTIIRYMGTFADNVLRNMRYLPFHCKARQLGGVIPTDIPAFIISAGPSLNKNILELKKAKNKAFFIAVDTAIKPLLNNGIIPDVFVIVDGLKPVSLIQVDGVSDVPLVTPFVAAESVLEYHKGKKFFFNDGSVIPEHIYQMCDMPFEWVESGGSVANNAFSLAVLIGFKTIIFVGQDLALTGNKTHADGTFEDKMKEQKFDTNSPGFFEVESVDGGKVITRADFNMYRLWFENIIELRGLDNVIDATEGGALIHGTKVMTLSEAIEKECHKEVDIKKIIGGIKSCFDEEKREKAITYLCELPEKLENLEFEIRRAKKEYRKIEKLCRQKNFKERDYIKKCKHVNRLVEDIEQKPESRLIVESLRGMDFAIRSVVMDTEDDVRKEGIEVACYGQFMLTNMEQCAKVVQKCASTVMQELKEHPEKFRDVSDSEENMENESD